MEKNLSTNIAFIGTGTMGAPIAARIIDAGYKVAVFNTDDKKCEELVAKGARKCSSVAEAAKGADVVFTMLGGPGDVETVYLAKEGLLRNVKAGTWLVDMTTSSPHLAKGIAEFAETANLHAFDCPVSGGKTSAEAGTLTLMAGISQDEAQEIEPILSEFASEIFWFDKPGAGQSAKLCSQLSLAGCMVGMADALALAQQSELDGKKVIDMINSGMGASRATELMAQKALDGDYRPGFTNGHMRKDIALAIQNSEDLDITLPGAETAFTLYDMLCQIGGENLGMQAISVLYQDEAAAVAAGLDWSYLDQDSLGYDHEEADGHDHAHGEECGCGHDHTHGDECGCGHDHAHGDECGCGHNHH